MASFSGLKLLEGGFGRTRHFVYKVNDNIDMKFGEIKKTGYIASFFYLSFARKFLRNSITL